MRFENLRFPPRPNPMFSGLSDFRIEKQIGDGGFSTVFLVEHLTTRNRYAIKRVDLSLLFEFNRDNVEHELAVHSQLSNRFVVRLFDFFGEGDLLYLVLELCERGTLFHHMLREGSLSLDEVKRIYTQTLLGVQYVHNQGFILRDLKPENILLDTQLNVKLCDFGWCVGTKEDSPYRRMQAGTLSYMSPESLRGHMQSEPSDVWALGVLLYELFMGCEPFSAENHTRQLGLVISSPPRFPPGHRVPAEAVSLILATMNLDPSKRPTVSAILESEFLTGRRPGLTRSSSVPLSLGLRTEPGRVTIHLPEKPPSEAVTRMIMERYRASGCVVQLRPAPSTSPASSMAQVSQTSLVSSPDSAPKPPVFSQTRQTLRAFQAPTDLVGRPRPFYSPSLADLKTEQPGFERANRFERPPLQRINLYQMDRAEPPLPSVGEFGQSDQEPRLSSHVKFHSQFTLSTTGRPESGCRQPSVSGTSVPKRIRLELSPSHESVQELIRKQLSEQDLPAAPRPSPAPPTKPTPKAPLHRPIQLFPTDSQSNITKPKTSEEEYPLSETQERDRILRTFSTRQELEAQIREAPPAQLAAMRSPSTQQTLISKKPTRNLKISFENDVPPKEDPLKKELILPARPHLQGLIKQVLKESAQTPRAPAEISINQRYPLRDLPKESAREKVRPPAQTSHILSKHLKENNPDLIANVRHLRERQSIQGQDGPLKAPLNFVRGFASPQLEMAKTSQPIKGLAVRKFAQLSLWNETVTPFRPHGARQLFHPDRLPLED